MTSHLFKCYESPETYWKVVGGGHKQEYVYVIVVNIGGQRQNIDKNEFPPSDWEEIDYDPFEE